MYFCKSDIYAGIVLYNPDIARLRKNIESIYNQVAKIVLIDNHSENIDEIESILCEFENISLLKNNKNFGIAKALNQIFEFASSFCVTWVYTLDQDTVSSENIIETYLKNSVNDNIGIICSNIFEEGLNQQLISFDTRKTRFLTETYEVDKCITSGSLTRVSAWLDIGGFDEFMFIDYVDFDFAIRLRKRDYIIMRNSNAIIYHELGDCEFRKIFSHKIRVSHHSAIRKYYMGRNIVYYVKKHKHNVNICIEFLRLIKIGLFIILFEKDKIKKTVFFLKGIREGVFK